MKRVIGIYSAKKIACFHCIPAFIPRLKTGVFCRISYNFLQLSRSRKKSSQAPGPLNPIVSACPFVLSYA